MLVPSGSLCIATTSAPSLSRAIGAALYVAPFAQSIASLMPSSLISVEETRKST